MYNREHKYLYWREERKKGKWHYVMKSFLMICCALLVGKVIGLFVFGELHTVKDIIEQLPADLLIMMLVGFPISVIGWYHEESKFFRALRRRDKRLRAKLDSRKSNSHSL
ncbi:MULTISPECIES: hypothetical protein [Vibrio]|jgi:uncharacterized BrkB/YihY/UPF0761 family membrane protein|uniref:hypothetical protein n=1 Tax=Vibrio TaxID=662 RepID=UPI000BFF9085|nr:MULTISPECIES: hypothetical protein [unclassified Vibrio]PHJ43259.1 hypothetical protein AK965_01875 [Vibrio sp. PID17_43]RIZ53774.1 hypothetical protein AK966_11605 [Vibrio sp. PID23_8]